MQISGITRTRAAIAATSAAALIVGVPAVTEARTAPADAALTPHTHFVMAADGSTGLTARGASIPNIDSVKSTIRTYYGATGGKASKTSSPYIAEMNTIEDTELAALPTVDPAAKKAIVFDADDTTLWTYDMEDGEMHFIFDPVLQNTWVQDQKFPATPGMVDFVTAAAAKGYAVFGLTGRKDDQKDATLGNLAKVGYTQFDTTNFFTKWVGPDTNKPSYITCVAKCTTVEYKAGTRKHIEQDLGYDIALNVGDQWSDLQGGFADDTLKLPNPTYYLPSPNLPGVDEPELAPRTSFTMNADGSSGLAQDGEGIPNIDSVKSTIRAYYNATSGIAAKDSSPYMTEMKGYRDTWAPRLRRRCERLDARHLHPAVVFDADDTTLWTYDMEDAAMGFNFNPALQNDWVMQELFVPTPFMRGVVKAANNNGCTIVGITGRNDSQRAATIDNLNKYYDDAFKTKYYFTKWTGVGASQQPSYVTCAAVKCTTIEYKSQTRKHVEDMGFRIIANFGDQFSDLKGGSADRAVKLPNPTYYLP